MEEKQCFYCQFWETYDQEADYPTGFCQRHAPHPKLIEDKTSDLTAAQNLKHFYTVIWPITQGHDWCGEFVRDETVTSPPSHMARVEV
jgi:hypothetical protein